MNNPQSTSVPQASRALPPARKGLPSTTSGNVSTPEAGERHPQLLTWKEAAALLGCSRTTLKRLKAAGEIGFTPIGSGTRPRIWFTHEDIDEFLKAKRHSPRRDKA